MFAGCGAVVTDAQRDGALGAIGIGLVFFLVSLAAIAALGHLSGAHFNPAVRLSFFVTRHLPRRDRGAYRVAQLAGASAGGLLLLLMSPGAPADLGAFGPLSGASLNPARSFGPALAAGQWQDFWLYPAGPLVGAPLGAIAYQFVHGEQPQPPRLRSDDSEETADGDRAVRLPA